MKMYDILRRGASLSAEKVAIQHGERVVTYRQLMASASATAHLLRELKLPDESRIAIISENCPEYVAVLFGIFGTNQIAVPLDNSLMPDKIATILSDCSASAIYIQSKYLRHLNKLIGGNEQIKYVFTDKEVALDTGEAELVSIDRQINGDYDNFDFDKELANIATKVSLDHLTYDSRPKTEPSLAALFYTSGSTGAGKGVMLSHRNLISNTIATVDYLKLTSDDSVIAILPFYYIYGNSLLLTHLMVGGSVVIDNRFAFPQAVLDTMTRTDVTGFSGVPSNFMILLNHSKFNAASFPKLRYLTQAGGGMAPDIIRQVARNFAGKELFIMYGQTEAAPRISWLPPNQLERKLGSAGLPVPGVSLRIVSPSGQELPVGETGEVTIAGDNVMLGYWNSPEEQATTLKDGWLFTGDIGHVDAEGYLYIDSRKKDIIKVGGFRVSAREIEECILEEPRVQEVAVVGVPDPILGEAIKAFVAVKSGCRLQTKEIKDHCQLRLSSRKIPSHVEFLDSLPKLNSGKVDRSKLGK